MTKWAGSYQIKKAAEILNKTEDEILTDLESGKLSAIVRAEITSSDGSRSFDWSLLPAEGVRRILAETHDIIEWVNYGIKRSCQSKQDQIRILTRDPNATEFHNAIYWDDSTQQPNEKAVRVANNLSIYTEEEISTFFDPVTVKALEKMFHAEGKWQSWINHASSNGLMKARESRAKYNPYKAALWFIDKGFENWDLSRCYRVLANNLPIRSIDKKHLFTGDFD